jgi:hypothetical protein
MKGVLAFVPAALIILGGEPGEQGASAAEKPGWKHLSTAAGDLETPSPGKQQTACLVLDIDKNGVNDFVITERTEAPSVVWYRSERGKWRRYLIEAGPLHIEAGADWCDVDGDGDLDVVAAGDFASPGVWWWENPYPQFAPQTPWKRRDIKNSGENKHHDLLFGDFDGDLRDELVFWNQNARKLFFAEIPADPRRTEPWSHTEIYSYSSDAEPPQRGTYPSWKGINEHEGLAKADIDGDGVLDIIGGGRWFKHVGGGRFVMHVVDAGYAFSRAAAGQLIEGGRPEILLVVGDGVAPLVLYEWNDGVWRDRVLIEAVNNGHSLALLDFNRDGRLDVFNAEMRLDGGNPEAKTRLLLGDGKGGFKTLIVDQGYDLHESKIADLDGDGDFDILGKPYNWLTPRLDVWLNQGK